MKPQLSTFVSSTTEVQMAIEAGASHLIIEDSKVSIRSFKNDFETPGFQKLIDLSDFARSLNPEIVLSANADFLIHDHQIPLLESLIQTMKQAQIPTLRFQDLGIVSYVKTHHPDIRLHFHPEIGFHNSEGIVAVAPKLDYITLSNELPVADLQKIRNAIPYK